MIEGHKLKTEHEMSRLAWHAANVMNVHLKKKVTPARLLEKEKGPMSIEDKKKEFEKLMQLLGKG